MFNVRSVVFSPILSGIVGGFLWLAPAPPASGVCQGVLPDSYGYSVVTSQICPELTPNLEDVSGSGTVAATVSSGDDVVESVPIGFAFTYYGNTYTNLEISSNGFLSFGGQGTSDRFNGAIPQTNGVNNHIAGWWDDLHPGSAGTVYFQTLGFAPNRRFLVQFDEVDRFGGGITTNTFQFKLFEDVNSIEIHYESVGPDSSASIGIENESGTDGIELWNDPGDIAPLPVAVRFQLDIVTNAFGPGPGGIEEVLTNALPGATIRFAPSLDGQTISLATTELELFQAVTIDATDLPRGVAINAGGFSRIFNITATNELVTLKGLTLEDGNAGSNPGDSGGGISMSAPGTILIVDNCLIRNCRAWFGGGIYAPNSRVLSVANTTFTDNFAYNEGGALFSVGTNTLINVTMTGNHAVGRGGGIQQRNHLTLLNTLIAENTAGVEGPDIDITFSPATILSGVNLIGDTDGSGLSAGTSLLVNADPQLMALGYYGGPTRTRHPMQGSPAIDPADSSTNAPIPLDQRGAPRLAGATLDIGAVEVQDVIPVTSEADSGTGSLREAIGLATNLGAVVRFDPTVGRIRVGDELVVSNGQSMVVDAGGERVLLHGQHSNRLFRVEAGGSLGLQGVTLTGGSEPADAGGAILNDGALSLADCRVVCNRAVSGGGIYSDTDSCLALAKTTVADNRAVQNGGGVGLVQGLVSTLDGCTVMENSARGGGGVFHYESRLRMRASSIIGNRATFSAGGLYNDSTLEITAETRLEHCTFSGNVNEGETPIGGGGLYNEDGKLDADFCTFTDNRAPVGTGSGILTYGDSLTRTELNHCVVAGNEASDLDLTGGTENAYISTGYNLVGSGQDLSSFGETGDSTGTADPNLAPLAWYGGWTPTRPPLTGSPVLNMGTNNPAFAVDQRGYPRRVSGNADIGAAESGPVVAIANLDDTGSDSLRDEIATAGLPGTLITLLPGVVELTQELLILPGRSVLLDGSSADITLEAAGFNHRLFNVSGEDSVLGLVGVSLEGGTAPAGENGGAISSTGTLSLVDCTLSGAVADEDGGGIHGTAGSRTWLERTTLEDHFADDLGGGMYTDGELRTVDCNWIGNRADFLGGGLLVSEEGLLTMKRCWVSGNEATSGVGGLGLLDLVNPGGRSYHLVQASTFVEHAEDGLGVLTTELDVKLDRCTVTGNRLADSGSSGSAVLALRSRVVDMVSCLVTENPDLVDVSVDTNELVSLGGNLVGTASTSLFTAAGDQTGITDAMLSPPGYYGGFTKTRHPLAGSPAIDPPGGTNLSFAASDQRGFATLLDGIDDAGAVEVGPVSLVTNTANAGAGTLREAVQAAGRGDVIRFDAGTFPATILSDTQVVVGADQAVFLDASDLAAGAVTLDGQAQDRLFQVEAGGTLALHNLALTNGQTGFLGSGGGILSTGSLTLVDSLVRGCRAESGGGGIYSAAGARLCMIDSGVVTNSNIDSGGGGGIWNGGEMRLEGCQLAHNQCLNPGGGGLYNQAPDDALMVNCLVVSNETFGTGGRGGGISNDGGMVMEGCAVVHNIVRDDPGGGIFNAGDLWITDSTLAGNRVDTSFGSGGGIDNRFGNLVMNRCTVAGNSSANDGGGIAHRASLTFGGSAVLTNCTISGNVATNRGGGFLDESGAQLEYCTLTGNEAAIGGGVASGGASGSEKMTFQTCIVSGNTGGDVDALGASRNYTSRGSNLIGTESDPTAFVFFDDIIGVTDPVLLPLGDYGGPTETHLPHSGSPAIDAVQRFTDAVVDQRAFARGEDGDLDNAGAPDIGAVELAPSQGDLALLWGTDLDGDGAAFGVEFAIGSDPLVNDTSTNAPGVAMGTLDAGVDMGDPVFTFGFNSNAVPYTEWRITGTDDLPGNNWTFQAFAYDGSMNTTNVSSEFEATLLPNDIVLRETNTVQRYNYRLEAGYVGPNP